MKVSNRVTIIIIIIFSMFVLFNKFVVFREYFTPTSNNCPDGGWTDPDPAANGRHFDCLSVPKCNSKARTARIYLDIKRLLVDIVQEI
jgi:hypothetical protein